VGGYHSVPLWEHTRKGNLDCSPFNSCFNHPPVKPLRVLPNARTLSLKGGFRVFRQHPVKRYMSNVFIIPMKFHYDTYAIVEQLSIPSTGGC
jgi:hypothetical protein